MSDETFRRRYRMNRVGGRKDDKGSQSVTVTIPREIIEHYATEYGITTLDFIRDFDAIVNYGADGKFTYSFEKSTKVKESME